VNAFDFAVLDVTPEPYAAAPTLRFRMRVDASDPGAVESIALRCQIRIEPQRRRYTDEEKNRLAELFGATPRWGDTLKPFLWTHASTTVRAFKASTEFDLSVPCTYDFEVAAAKYLHSIGDGDIPLLLLFSGTVFAQGPHGLHVFPVSWDCETRHRLPVRVWRTLMDLYFPGSGWLRLRADVLDRLLRFKARRALATFDDVVLALLREAGESEEAA